MGGLEPTRRDVFSLVGGVFAGAALFKNEAQAQKGGMSYIRSQQLKQVGEYWAIFGRKKENRELFSRLTDSQLKEFIKTWADSFEAALSRIKKPVDAVASKLFCNSVTVTLMGSTTFRKDMDAAEGLKLIKDIKLMLERFADFVGSI